MRLLAVDYNADLGASFPDSLDAAMTAYLWLLTQGAAQERIMLLGDGAGGGLAVALAMRLRDRGEITPSSMALISPWIDLTCSGESFRFARDNILTRSSLCAQARAYAGSYSLREQYISPMFGGMGELPPTIIVGGTRDLLLSDGVELAKRINAAHGYCELHLWRGQLHDFPVMLPGLRASGEALGCCRSFANVHMKPQRV